jgi:glycerol uptake facilitator-like aquaporin
MPSPWSTAITAEGVASAAFVLLSLALAPTAAPATAASAALVGAALATASSLARPASGGHVSSATTLAAALCGRQAGAAAGAWALAQLAGALAGGLLAALLIPGASLWQGAGAPGCAPLPHGAAASWAELGWEAAATSSAALALLAGERAGSLAVGVAAAVWVAAAGAAGAAVSLVPGRALAPVLLFGCDQAAWKGAAARVAAQCAGAVLAAAVAPLVAARPPEPGAGVVPTAADPLLATPAPATPGLDL